MHSTSDDQLDPRESVYRERREAALAAFIHSTPVIYRHDVDIHPTAVQWAAQGTDAPRNLFLTGAIGVGKTHTAWQAARLWLERRVTRTGRRPSIEAWRSTSLFDALRPDNHDYDARVLTAQLQKADLLYIDDLAAARVSPTGWTQERLYELFDERYINRRPVLITCDVLPGATGDIVGDRVQSRLREMFRGGVLLLEGADRREGAAA
ncbi:ATP-binding protein [Streptomyces wuyuanensis]|uniref:DNA replication protein DnaC n=1 Tax=Streptomyces wuyuanensis TaxID=1196353 RepID=A0A1G9ZD82_9ACTN|nr:ATP-binding protein [Streptomyces wuyuanensis]SDN18576.1 DNA replication protein DnaC [Streptomyces wuyuanensis]